MSIFQWDDSYSVGIDSVDAEHRHLVDLINRLDESVSTGGDGASLRAIVNELYEYAGYHFAHEEQVMAEAGEPLAGHLARHQAQHAEFADTIRRLEQTLDETGDAPPGALLDYLIKWLSVHILGSDKEMAHLLSDEDRAQRPLAHVDPGTSEEVERLQRLLDREVAERNLLSALRESEWRFRVLANSVPVLIWMGDANLQRNFFNQRWLEFTGRQAHELAGEGWQTSMHPDDREAYLAGYREAVAVCERFSHEFRLRRADGAYRWFLETAVPRFLEEGNFAGYVGSGVDITERKEAEEVLRRSHAELEAQVDERTRELLEANRRLEAEKTEQQHLIDKLEEAHTQLLQSEKMASIGQLAAGVAHEINNPVGYVMSNTTTLQEYVRNLLRLVDRFERVTPASGSESADIAALKEEMDYEFLREDILSLLSESQQGMTRVKQIVQDLKEFSHVDEAEWKRADLNKGLQSTLNVVWNELKYKAEIVKDFEALPPIQCLPGQLNQVFMNMLVNAVQSIEERGTITLRTRALDDAVQVQISDTGRGIPEDKLTRIFDPFFTTKGVGEGTGLGLSIAYGIVEKHGGHIQVESREGEGTTFTIRLPLEPPAAAPA